MLGMHKTPEEQVRVHLTDAIQSLMAADRLIDSLPAEVCEKVAAAVDSLILEVGGVRRALADDQWPYDPNDPPEIIASL